MYVAVSVISALAAAYIYVASSAARQIRDGRKHLDEDRSLGEALEIDSTPVLEDEESQAFGRMNPTRPGDAGALAPIGYVGGVSGRGKGPRINESMWSSLKPRDLNIYRQSWWIHDEGYDPDVPNFDPRRPGHKHTIGAQVRRPPTWSGEAQKLADSQFVSSDGL
jgi:hypothetical protein